MSKNDLKDIDLTDDMIFSDLPYNFIEMRRVPPINEINSSLKLSTADYVENTHEEKVNYRSELRFSSLHDFGVYRDDISGTMKFKINYDSGIYCFRCAIILLKEEDGLCHNCERDLLRNEK
jgi:hypothetical protein